jgi:hypothetical protein
LLQQWESREIPSKERITMFVLVKNVKNFLQMIGKEKRMQEVRAIMLRDGDGKIIIETRSLKINENMGEGMLVMSLPDAKKFSKALQTQIAKMESQIRCEKSWAEKRKERA